MCPSHQGLGRRPVPRLNIQAFHFFFVHSLASPAVYSRTHFVMTIHRTCFFLQILLFNSFLRTWFYLLYFNLFPPFFKLLFWLRELLLVFEKISNTFFSYFTYDLILYIIHLLYLFLFLIILYLVKPYKF